MSAFAGGSVPADTLEQLSLRATKYFTGTDVDLPGIVWFEHLNLEINKGMKQAAYAFYRDILGCTPDVSPSFHLNIGKQQFHLGESSGAEGHVINGSIGLVVPSLLAIKDACETVGKRLLGGTKLKITQYNSANESMTLTGPFGNTFHLFQIGERVDTKDPGNLTFMERKHLNVDTERAVLGRPGIKFMEWLVKDVGPVCTFYKDIFGCNTFMDKETGCGVVQAGPSVHFLFRPCGTLSEELLKKQRGVHVCCYVSKFKQSYDKLKSANAIWTNPRFKTLDKCDCWEDALGGRQYRFKDFVDPTTKRKIFELEHETRAMRHYQYLKEVAYVPFER
jgi:hypothetical protein